MRKVDIKIPNFGFLIEYGNETNGVTNTNI
jgi:hypothetical protein